MKEIKIGDIFDGWVIIDGPFYTGVRKNTKNWYCLCECFAEALVREYDLRKYRSKRCRSCANKRRSMIPNCHPDRPYCADGMCRRCYYKTPRQKLLAAVRNEKHKYSYRNRRGYGITQEDYASLLDYQDGKCAICGREKSGRKMDKILHVDHDHTTGIIRGLLCQTCNLGLGYFKDDPKLL